MEPISTSERLVNFVENYGAITLDLALFVFYRGHGADAPRKALERLEARRKLRSRSFGEIRYWVLHHREARRRGVARRRTEPKGRNFFLDLYGRVLVTTLPSVSRRF